MTELALFEKSSRIVVSSRIIAERFGKRHADTTETIRNLIAENSAVRFMFLDSEYETERGKKYPEYLCTRDGFSLLVMGFTGKDALAWKVKYIQAFNAMEAALMERQTSDWLQTREQGKLIRRDETDAIQSLILMAQEQGSQHSGKMYMLYSKLVNQAVGLEGGMRDRANYKQLMLVALLEDLVSKTIFEEVDNGTYYKTVYQKCKAKVQQFAELTYLTPMRRISA